MVILEAQLILDQIGTAAAPQLAALVRRGLAMLIEFFAAHREDPARIKPETYWYGHPYSYLTRDMVDSRTLVARRTASISPASPRRMVLPGATNCQRFRAAAPGRTHERPFVEYPHVGRRRASSHRRRVLSSEDGSRRHSPWTQEARLGRSALGPRRAPGGDLAGERASGPTPPFASWYRGQGHDRSRLPGGFSALELGRRPRKLLFVPTHQWSSTIR